MRFELERSNKNVTPEYCKSNGKIRATFEDGKAFVEINTIEDVMSIAEKTKHEIIVNAQYKYIEIYDDCRE